MMFDETSFMAQFAQVTNKINLQCKNIIQEYEQMHNLDDVIYSLIEDEKSAIRTRHEEFVKSMLLITLESSPTSRTEAGKLFAELLSKNVLSVSDITQGINNVLRDWVDQVMDYPQFFSYIAAIITPLLLSKTVSFDFNNLKDACASIRPKSSSVFFDEVLQKILNSKETQNIKENGGILWIYNKWRMSDYVPLDIFIPVNQLNKYFKNDRVGVFLLSMTIYDKMRLIKHHLLYDIMRSWISTYVKEEIIKCPQFVRAITIAIVIDCLKSNHSYEEFFDHVYVKLLTFYIRSERLSKPDIQAREVQCLYGIQLMSAALEYPEGMVLKLYHKLYEDSVISKKSFELWKNENDFKAGFDEDLETKTMAVTVLNSFFVSLSTDESDEDETTDSAVYKSAEVSTVFNKATDSKNKNEELKTKEVNKRVRSILNKITSNNMVALTEKFKSLPIDTMERLENTINLIFEKAIEEQSFAPLYSSLCSAMQSVQVSCGEGNKMTSFKKLIISKCQSLFELDKAEELDAAKKLAEIKSCKNLEKIKELQLEFEENQRRSRKRSVGNCRFIGELFKQKVLTANIMMYCILNLATKHVEEPLECLCNLLKTVGKELEQFYNLNEIFNKLNELTSKEIKSKIPSRIRFLIQDVIDLRENKWVPRPVEDIIPKFLNEIENYSLNEGIEKLMAAYRHEKRGNRGDFNDHCEETRGSENKGRRGNDNEPNIVRNTKSKKQNYAIDQSDLHGFKESPSMTTLGPSSKVSFSNSAGNKMSSSGSKIKNEELKTKIAKNELDNYLEVRNADDDKDKQMNNNSKDFSTSQKTGVNISKRSEEGQTNSKKIAPRFLCFDNSTGNFLKVYNEDESVENEFDYFCTRLAFQLKTMPRRCAIKCQKKIQKIMDNECVLQYTQ